MKQFIPMNIPKFCRICFDEAKTFVSLYDETQVNDSTIASLIMECSSVQLRLFDSNYPEQICLECLHELERAFNFRRRCLMSEKLLNDHLNEHFQTPIKQEDNSFTNNTFVDNFDSILDVKHSVENFELPNRFTKQNKTSERKKTKKLPNFETNGKQSNQPKIKRIKLINRKQQTKQSNVERIKLKNSRPPILFPNRNSKEKTACMFCEKTFDGRKFWRIHLLEHRINGVITCPKENCCSSFKKIKSFEVHSSTVHADRQYICPHCGVTLTTPIGWREHIRRKHLKILPHKCEFCSKAFLFPNILREHVLVMHSKQRDFACDICDKKFATARSRKAHIRSHDDTCKFPCPNCPNTYKNKDLLNHHIQTHGPKIHQCTYCPKSFSMQRSLERHLCTHTGKRPVACKLCDKRFIQHSSLYWHLKTHHGKRKPINAASTQRRKNYVNSAV